MGVGIIPKYSKYRVLVFVFPHVRHIQVFLTPPSIHLSISPNPSMDDWWIRKYESYGFQFSKELTDMIRGVAQQEINSGNAPNGAKLNGAFLFVAALLSNWILRHEQTYSHPVSFSFATAQHVWLTMKVFINPMVAALPQHAHLFFEDGCYDGKLDGGGIKHRKCGTGKWGHLETPLPEAFRPLVLTPEMDQAWEKLVQENINMESQKS